MSNVLRGNFGNSSPEINLVPLATEPINGFDADGTQPEASLIPDIEGSQYSYLNNCAEADRLLAHLLASRMRNLPKEQPIQIQTRIDKTTKE